MTREPRLVAKEEATTRRERAHVPSPQPLG